MTKEEFDKLKKENENEIKKKVFSLLDYAKRKKKEQKLLDECSLSIGKVRFFSKDKDDDFDFTPVS